MIKGLLRFPFILWILIAGGLAYRDFKTWEETVKAPLEVDIESKKQTLAALAAQTKKAEEFKRSRAEKLAALQDLAERFKATADRLPRQPNLPDLLKSLADLSDKAGLDFSRFRPLAARRDQYPFLVATPLEVTLKGTYIQVMTFLDSAANLTRIVATERLVMETPTVKGIAATVSVNANLVTYYIEDAGIEGAVGGVPKKGGN